MIIKLFNFNKKTNSTKKPLASDEYLSLTGRIRTECTIINPEIDFKLEQFETAPTYNYAQIEAFNRYYFINNWTFTDGLWSASMSVDVLASFKEDIESDREYVLRSASKRNGAVMDTFYPSVTSIDTQRIEIGEVYDYTYQRDWLTYFNRNYEDGYIVFGVTGGAGAYGVTYYYTDPDGFKVVLDNLMSYQPTNFGDIGEGLAKQLANPIQYITSCRWYPISPGIATFTNSIQIQLGYYTIEAPCRIMDAGDSSAPSIHHLGASFDLTEINHPQAEERGSYLNAMGEYKVVFNPFGTFTLNPLTMVTSGTVFCHWWIDFTTGQSWLECYGRGNHLLATSSTSVGVDLPITQMNTDLIGTASGAIGGIISGGLALATGNFAGAIAGTATGIMSASEASQPTVTTKGTPGSLIPYKAYRPYMSIRYTYMAEDDPVNNGRPLCQVQRLDQLEGFVMVSNSHFSSDECLQTEIDMIKNYLNNGVYLE